MSPLKMMEQSPLWTSAYAPSEFPKFKCLHFLSWILKRINKEISCLLSLLISFTLKERHCVLKLYIQMLYQVTFQVERRSDRLEWISANHFPSKTKFIGWFSQVNHSSAGRLLLSNQLLANMLLSNHLLVDLLHKKDLNGLIAVFFNHRFCLKYTSHCFLWL